MYRCISCRLISDLLSLCIAQSFYSYDWLWEPKITLSWFSIGLFGYPTCRLNLVFSSSDFIFLSCDSIGQFLSVCYDLLDLRRWFLKAGKEISFRVFFFSRLTLLLYSPQLQTQHYLFFGFWFCGLMALVQILVGAMVIYTLYSFPPNSFWKKEVLWAC